MHVHVGQSCVCFPYLFLLLLLLFSSHSPFLLSFSLSPLLLPFSSPSSLLLGQVQPGIDIFRIPKLRHSFAPFFADCIPITLVSHVTDSNTHRYEHCGYNSLSFFPLSFSFSTTSYPFHSSSLTPPPPRLPPSLTPPPPPLGAFHGELFRSPQNRIREQRATHTKRFSRTVC